MFAVWFHSFVNFAGGWRGLKMQVYVRPISAGVNMQQIWPRKIQTRKSFIPRGHRLCGSRLGSMKLMECGTNRKPFVSYVWQNTNTTATHPLCIHISWRCTPSKMAETNRPITAMSSKALQSPQATMTKDRSDAITRAITNYIVLDKRPFSTVERQGFKELISVLELNYKLISNTHLSKTIIP